MKWTFLLVCFFIFSCQGMRPVEQLQPTKMQKLVIPDVKEVRLAHGITCFLLEDHTLPFVNIEVTVRAGSVYEGVSKKGLARFTGRFMRSGGITSLPPSVFDRHLDEKGMLLESQIGREKGEVVLKVLSEHLDEGMHYFFELLFQPRFDPSRIDVVKNSIKDDIRREQDEPETVAAKAFRALVYGAENPWASEPSEEDVERLTITDAKHFHETFFQPQNVLLAISGDFSTDHVVSLLNDLLKDLTIHPVNFPSVPETPYSFKAEKQWIQKNVTQSYIHLGHLGIKRENPDRFSLMVMNYILGGTFKSRLVEEIRTERGLVYYIASSLTPETDYGMFVINLATKSESTKEAVVAVTSHLEKMAKSGDVTDAELLFAKRSLLNQQIFSFGEPSLVLRQRILFRFYGFPDDYWKTMRDGVEQVTKEDIARVAKIYLHPDQLKQVVVGKQDD